MIVRPGGTTVPYVTARYAVRQLPVALPKFGRPQGFLSERNFFASVRAAFLGRIEEEEKEEERDES
eukprot:765003-Hanusia_phi.AAC.4